ncbi:uncharacterized protein Dana_GF26471, isoform A [Drosophila ananassae]|uniref:Uncharacterized protein, isoform A n=1 Tax=Drosophila ananassae TaxID=7217 RepID=A0A0P8XVK8_DROAN|nr:uncharacterized protein LOC26513880 isoform X1 [Drosophila ananassae]KPU73371.1 uncharacterized protein Dana_GF26471, isoform A [Drosophila ananassae]
MRSGESTGRVGENSKDKRRGREQGGTRENGKWCKNGGIHDGNGDENAICRRPLQCIVVHMLCTSSSSSPALHVYLCIHQVEHHRPPPSDGATGSCPTLGDNFKLVNPLWRTWIRMHEELSAGPGA